MLLSSFQKGPHGQSSDLAFTSFRRPSVRSRSRVGFRTRREGGAEWRRRRRNVWMGKWWKKVLSCQQNRRLPPSSSSSSCFSQEGSRRRRRDVVCKKEFWAEREDPTLWQHFSSYGGFAFPSTKLFWEGYMQYPEASLLKKLFALPRACSLRTGKGCQKALFWCFLLGEF